MFLKRNLACSFCGKSSDQVSKLVAGPKVFICDECVAVATRIMNESGGDAAPPPAVHISVLQRLTRWLRRDTSHLRANAAA